MKYFKTIFILSTFGLLLLLPPDSQAQTLTLEQALSLARDKNRDIEKAREYANYVQGRYQEERAAALPQLSLNAATILSRDNSQTAQMGFNTRQRADSADLSLTQPLFTWGKISAAMHAAELGIQTSEQQLRYYRQATEREVTTAFYNILLAQDLHGLAREDLAQKERLLDEAKRKYAIGTATDYDVLSAEVSVNNSKPELIRNENNVRISIENLRLLLALGQGPLDISGSLSASVTPLPAYADAVATALKMRPDLIDLRLRVAIYGDMVKIASAENKPRLDLKASAGWHALNLDGSGLNRQADGAAWSVGAFLSFPFFDGFRTSGKTAQARSDLRTKQIEESKLVDSIALDVRNAIDRLQESAKILEAAGSTVKQAERLLQMTEKGYQYGVKIRLEVEDAQLNLIKARTNLSRSLRDYNVAQINYRWAIGTAGE